MDSRGGAEAVRSLLLERKAAADGWLSKIIDVEETKEQIIFAVPMVLTNIAYYFIPLVSVMFAGHLGEHELAASNLANSWAVVTGFSFMGLWISLISGQAAQAMGLLLLSKLSKWRRIALSQHSSPKIDDGIRV